MEEPLLDMYIKGTPLDTGHLHRLLQILRLKRDLSHTRNLHCIIASTAAATLPVIAEHLVSLFSSLDDCLLESTLAFCTVSQPTLRCYHFIMSIYARHNITTMPFELYCRLLNDGLQPNEFTFPPLLKLCGNIRAMEKGLRLHSDLVILGLDCDVVIGNTLIDMYTKCGSLELARKIFDELRERTLTSWCAMISGYAQHGYGLSALTLYQEMQQTGIQPNVFLFSCILKSCSVLKLLEHGQYIHDEIVRSDVIVDVALMNTLIDMYAKCGKLDDAWNVFDRLSIPNLLSWGAIITGCLQNGDPLSALYALETMQKKCYSPDKVIYICILKACASLGALEEGTFIHDQIVRTCMDSDVGIRDALMDMYSKCGLWNGGGSLFKVSGNKATMPWITMLVTYTENGSNIPALVLFEKVQHMGFKIDKMSSLCVLSACGQLQGFLEGMLIHNLILYSGLEIDMAIGNTLIDMYGKCGNIREARNVFEHLQNRDVVSWGAMMAGYVQHGQGMHAIDLFQEMTRNCIKPDSYIFACVLKACATEGWLSEGKRFHHELSNRGIKIDSIIGSTLVDMYAKSGDIEEAYSVFKSLEERDLLSWGAMIAGSVFQGNGTLAVQLYAEMQRRGVQTDAFTMSSILKACGIMGSILQGHLVHDQIIRKNLESELENALIDMYIKCGNPLEALTLFEKSQGQSISSWGALIAGCAEHGYPKLAISIYERMQSFGVTPDETIYTNLFSAFGHAGQAGMTYDYCKNMVEDHAVLPSTKLYNCMADVYARAGYLAEAEQLLHSMPNPVNMYGQTSLLSASLTHGKLRA